MLLCELLQQANKLLIDDNAIDLGKVEYVGNVVLLEPIVDGDKDAPGRGHAKNGIEEGRSVGCQDTNTSKAMLDQVIRKTPGTVCELAIGAAQGGAVGGDVDDGLCIGLDGGSALKEVGWGQLVDVVALETG